MKNVPSKYVLFFTVSYIKHLPMGETVNWLYTVCFFNILLNSYSILDLMLWRCQSWSSALWRCAVCAQKYGGDMFLQNFGNRLKHDMASQSISPHWLLWFSFLCYLILNKWRWVLTTIRDKSLKYNVRNWGEILNGVERWRMISFSFLNVSINYTHHYLKKN
jgi:hypothetical protein